MGRWWFLILPMIVFAVSISDLFVTLHFEQAKIGFSEANPIAKYIWDTGGDIGLIVFKLTVTLASCLCMGSVIKNKNRSWVIAVSIFGLLGCIVLIGWWILWFFSATVA